MSDKDRQRTRDLLEPFDPRMRYHYSAGHLGSVYPWSHLTSTQLDSQFFSLAQEHGYKGEDPSELWDSLLSAPLIKDTLENFPIPGRTDTLYLDLNTNVLYHFITTTEDDYWNNYQNLAGLRMERDEVTPDTVYLYIPIATYVLSDLTINGDEGL